MELTTKKKITIRRADVEKIIVTLQQIITPVKLGEPFRVVIEYSPEQPTVEIVILGE